MPMEKHIVQTERCGPLVVYVQGDLSQQDKKAVFMTVHDLGCNHTSFHDFVEHSSMKNIKERSIFIHVDIPGQEDDAMPLPDDYSFPTMQTIGEDLVNVLDTLHIKYVIGLGEGAGANILARFGMRHHSRCMGLILLHCTSTTAGIMEYFKDKLIGWKLGSGMNTTAEQYLVFHKFGTNIEEQLDQVDEGRRESVIRDFQDKLKTKINPRNLKKYVDSFLNRTDLSGQLTEKLKVDTLLVTGARASHIHTVHTMHTHMDKSKASLLKIDDVGDVLLQAPDKFAQSLLLFSKGIGMLTSVTMPGVERQRTFSGDAEARARRQRTMSMEEYDKPNIRRLSVTK